MQYLIYLDLSGRPKLRRYVVAGIAILLLLSSLLIVSTLGGSSDEAPPAAAAAVTKVIESTSLSEVLEPHTAAPPAEKECPSNSLTWSFAAVFPGDNYQRIEPACVYDGLERTAAWMLLERQGYSKHAAAELLGFAQPPWSPILTVSGFTNTQGPIEMALIPEWPAHPAYQFWQVDRDGQAAVAISLRGCYRQNGTAFCVLALDRAPGSAVSMLGEIHFASHAAQLPGQRSFFLLEYVGSNNWHLLGQIEELSLEIEDLGQLASERKVIAERFGAVPWDAGWLFQHFGLAMQPLPEGWRLFDMDESAISAITEELNQFISPALGGEDD